MFRSLFVILTIGAAVGAAHAQSRRTASPWRNNVNLPGGDYRSIDMNTSDPRGCKSACERDPKCRAWTFVKPDESGRAYCWLKDSVPEATSEDCCISAVKGEGGAAPTGGTSFPANIPQRPWRNNVNLPGGDYRSIDMNTADPTSCRAACERDAKCRAWTLVKPDESGRSYCWLKDSIPEAIRDNCCISAVKGEGGSTNRERPRRWPSVLR